jgi:uncharacterized membrane protein YfcA
MFEAVSWWGLLFLLLAAFFAGFVDSVAGGGGLIQVPALFAASPSSHPATLLGTNKLASVAGTLSAAKKYLKAIKLPQNVLIPAILTAFLGSFLGAWVVKGMSVEVFRILLPIILLALLIYTYRQKTLGLDHAPLHEQRHASLKAAALGGVVGFYDGFFGPGTGSFLLIGFVRVFGFDFLHASASAKLVNATTNLAAILLFGIYGHLNWPLGLAMMSCNLLGSLVGVSYALKHGNQFIRKVFLLVVAALILKTGYDALNI